MKGNHATDSGSKLNQLLASWPAGTVQTASALNARGYSYHLVRHYRAQHWLQEIGSGAVVRAGDKVDWMGALYAIQKQLRLSVHVAARTALELQRSAHYLRSSSNTIQLLGTPGEKLPTWFRQHSWGVEIKYSTANLFADAQASGLEKFERETFAVDISSRERAILELLHGVPKVQSFDEARLIFEGLTNLRPSVLQRLLEQCRSIKVKRLFLALAEHAGFSWYKHLNESKIDLGSGKRNLFRSGKMHPKYLITLPKDMFADKGK